jgi:type I restriction enzyme S subunit
LLTDEFNEQMEKLQKGASYPAVTDAEIKSILLRFPKSLTEQQRIVVILDEAFAAIAKAKANAEQNLKNAKDLFESYLQGVFENGNWEEKKLNEITEVKDGTHDSPKYIKEGIPFVTQKNIRQNGLSFDDTRFITETDHEKFFKRSNVTYGDILISMIGANRGMAAIVDDKRIFSIKNVGLIKESQNINKHFLLYYLKSSLAMKYVLYMSNGGAQEFVGLTALRSFPIPYPTIKEQDDIVKKLDAISSETNKLVSIYQKKIESLAELKKSVLQKAFTGELKK